MFFARLNVFFFEVTSRSYFDLFLQFRSAWIFEVTSVPQNNELNVGWAILALFEIVLDSFVDSDFVLQVL